MSSRLCLLFVVASFVSGCASTQLNYNTLDLASTTDDLLQKQVMYNIEKFIDSDTAIPAQVVITSGTASTTNSVAPSFTTPLDSVVTTAAGKVTQAVKNPASLSLNASDTWGQNWGFAPITDTFQMRRLRALYRYAVDGDAAAFIDRYPLLYKSISINRQECLRDASGKVKLKIEQTDPGSATGSRTVTLCATATSANSNSLGGFQVGATTVSESELVPDEYYLRGPACAVCLRRGRYRKAFLTKNENLQAGWLRWVNLPGARNLEERPPAQGDRSLGVYGHHELFVAQGQGDKLVEFTLFVQAASTQTDLTSSSSGPSSLGGAKSGSKPATQSIVDSQGNVSTVFPGN
jgi:hypothetical protein